VRTRYPVKAKHFPFILVLFLALELGKRNLFWKEMGEGGSLFQREGILFFHLVSTIYTICVAINARIEWILILKSERARLVVSSFVKPKKTKNMGQKEI